MVPYSHSPNLCLNHWCQRSQNWLVLWRLHLPEITHTTHKDVLFFTGDWNAKVGSQEIHRIIGKFGLGVWNEAGERLTEFYQENILVIAIHFSNNTRDDSTHGHHQMVNTEIRLIMFFVAKDGETLKSAKTRPSTDCGSGHEHLYCQTQT